MQVWSLTVNPITLRTPDLALCCMLLRTALSISFALSACLWWPSSVRAADVDVLLGQMTLDEKLALLHGRKDPEPAIGFDSAGYLPGVPRLGIPPLRLTDGPAGIRTTQSATALPAPVALAASFDPAVAKRYGEVLGFEGVARNQQVLLSPMVNLVRVPYAGRNFETFGEDPLLAGAIVAAEIEGIQQNGMMATVKHFAANNQEQDRLTIDATVDERTLHELYLPAFEAAVKAGVASVMCAYNQINGQFGCENTHLLQDVLRRDWGFEGFVMTDWWARHSLDALANGLNVEMPGYTHPEYPVDVYFDAPLRQAVQQGRIAETAVDAAVRPLLVMMDRFGMIDGSVAPPAARNIDAHQVALDTALAGAVLLKNDNAVLPLANAQLKDTVIFGPTAAFTLAGGGGSSRVLPSARDNTLAALAALNDGVSPAWQPGYDLDGHTIPASALALPDEAGNGLRHIDYKGEIEDVVTLERTGNNPLRGTGMWYWDGEIVAPETGSYELMVQTDGPVASIRHNGKRILFNDSGVLSNASLVPTRDGLRNAAVTVNLQAGEHFLMRVEAWTGDDRPVQLRLAWLTPSQRQASIDAAVQSAAAANTAVVFAHVEGTEGGDHKTLALPGYQDALITALAQRTDANVVVVLNTGAPVTMPWIDEVAAVLQLWYPGQAGGEATSQLLMGLANPSGKLPVSFPRNEADIPVNEPLRYPGVDNKQEYSEGLLMGYRWYDARNIEPLFAFGHGLSYTTFDYSDLELERVGDEVNISFTLRNSGQRTGLEAAQVYLEQEGVEDVTTEVRKLVAFSKVTLTPGESRRLALTVPARSFDYWNTARHDWSQLPGAKVFHVGSSSRDLRLKAMLQFSPRQ